MAPAEPGDAEPSAAQPDLCWGLRLRAPADGPAALAAGASEHRQAGRLAAGLGGEA
ncbi:MAG TPA: hypothetical protein P5330_07895 [Candidatus Competibacteraceae bacterium]|nr:hypothetical protein [Candidatus Competibacteraceae bacterium]